MQYIIIVKSTLKMRNSTWPLRTHRGRHICGPCLTYLSSPSSSLIYSIYSVLPIFPNPIAHLRRKNQEEHVKWESDYLFWENEKSTTHVERSDWDIEPSSGLYLVGPIKKITELRHTIDSLDRSRWQSNGDVENQIMHFNKYFAAAHSGKENGMNSYFLSKHLIADWRGNENSRS